MAVIEADWNSCEKVVCVYGVNDLLLDLIKLKGGL